MYQSFIYWHSLTRWLVLAGMIYSIFRAFKGYRSAATFSKTDDKVRHWTATIAHIQLMLGITLYAQSPIVTYFWQHKAQAIKSMDATFFGIIHILVMLTAIVIITIGSALAKRTISDNGKFKTILIWYGIALVLILIAIPWPFSPLAARPYFR